jgi:hypothetical protein
LVFVKRGARGEEEGGGFRGAGRDVPFWLVDAEDKEMDGRGTRRCPG